MKVKRLLWIPVILLGLVVLLLGFLTIAEYRPRDVEDAVAIRSSTSETRSLSSLTLLSWNIGYGGLDRQTDFILDGGKMSRPRSIEAVEESLEGIRQTLQRLPADFYMLQEIDLNSSRTGKINETAFFAEVFPSWDSYFAANYNALIVPFPLNDPIGKVHSGVLSLSRYPVEGAVRWQLPGYYSWPVRTVHLKRCALETRIPSSRPGTDWILLNVHLTAYGDGSMRVEQLAFLKQKIEEYYRQGHLVVIGGDWNSLFPGITRDQFGAYTTKEENLAWLQLIPGDWTPEGWQWAIDSATPSCRSLEQPYVPGENMVCLIDGFLVSPNVQIDSVEGYSLGFEYSDHNPVSLEVSIRQ